MSTYKDPQTTSIIEEDDDDLLLRAEREKLKAQGEAAKNVAESATATEAESAPAPAPTPTPEPAPSLAATQTPTKSAAQQAYETQQQKVLESQEQLAKTKDDYFTSMLNLQKETVDATIAQNNVDTTNEARRAKWGAATEAATALANLIGTTAGASHQQYHQYSMDWMKEADKNRREREKESRTLRQSLMQLQGQQAAQRAQDALALESTRMTMAQNNANYALKQSEIAQKGMLAQEKERQSQIAKVLQMYQRAYLSAETTAEKTAAAKQYQEAVKAFYGLDITFPKQVKVTGKGGGTKPNPPGGIKVDADGYPIE